MVGFFGNYNYDVRLINGFTHRPLLAMHLKPERLRRLVAFFNRFGQTIFLLFFEPVALTAVAHWTFTISSQLRVQRAQ